jgi:hypothetical protein
MNKIIITDDEMYPMELSDAWGGSVYVSKSTIIHDEQWNNFIKSLTEARKKILENRRK